MFELREDSHAPDIETSRNLEHGDAAVLLRYVESFTVSWHPFFVRDGNCRKRRVLALPFGRTRAMNHRAQTMRRKGPVHDQFRHERYDRSCWRTGRPRRAREVLLEERRHPAPKRKTAAKAKKENSRSSKKAPKTAAKNVAPRPESIGATLADLMKATDWQAHSVRGFISTAGKKHNVTIEYSKNDAGDRTYRIAK